jgi:hypothetical protein
LPKRSRFEPEKAAFRRMLQGLKQVAEKLLRAVGQGFIPGTKATESTRALAPEVCFSSVWPGFRPFSAACKARRLFCCICGTTEVVP